MRETGTSSSCLGMLGAEPLPGAWHAVSAPVTSCSALSIDRPGVSGKYTCAAARAAHPARSAPAEFRLEDADGGCSLQGGERDFLNAASNRTLWLAGTSMMYQVYHAIQCRLETALGTPVVAVPTPMPNGTIDVCFGEPRANTLGFGFGTRVCFVEIQWTKDATVGKEPTARLGTLLGTPDAPRAGAARPGDVVILSMGDHFVPSALDEGEAHMRALAVQLEALRAALRGRLPTIMWRENSPQHFPTHNGVWFAGISHTKFKTWPKAPDPLHPCNASLAPERLDAANVLNRRLEPHVRAMRLPILRVWRTLAARGVDHVGRWRPYGYDCNHQCEPSSALLFQADLMIAGAAAAFPRSAPV